MAGLQHTCDRKLVQELVNHYQNGTLNLEPGFQRQSVWKDKDRALLIDSIVRNYPLPALFLYKRHQDGQLVYDVIDGKQRLEAIFKFMGIMRGRFEAKVTLPGADRPERVDWRRLCKRHLQHLITGYAIPTIEVDGEFTDIVDVFVRINSTGKALTPQEKRHARYYHSAFLKEAHRLAQRYEQTFLELGVLSSTDISRMKHVELVSELMLTIYRGEVLNKKAALDAVMSSNDLTARELRCAVEHTTRALNRVRRMFPKLYTTRFRRVTDFYTLATLIAKYEREGLILTDRRRNQLAWDLLVRFGTKVDEIREKQRRLEGATADEQLYASYLITVSQMTDDAVQRRKREQILDGLLRSLFELKDAQRTFSPEQRRILWNTTEVRKCAKCHRILGWSDFTVDHIKPYSKGGRTELANAALMCRTCNARKRNA